jgi:hypothetical protein
MEAANTKSPGLTRNGTRLELLSSERPRDRLAIVPVVTLNGEITADEALRSVP